MSRKKRGRQVNKKRSFFGENYGKSWRYLKESKNFIYAAISFFLLFILIGFFVPAPEVIKLRILELIEEMLKETEGLSQFGLIKFIFLNNIQSAFLGLFFGVVFGIFSLVTAIANGYLLGFVAVRVMQVDGVLTLWKLFPHGIFELPALFLSVGLGLKLGLWLIIEPIKFYWGRNKLIVLSFILFYLPTLIINLMHNSQFTKIMKKSFSNFKINFFSSLKVFIFVIIPLLILAAFIEGSLIFLFSN